MEPSIVNLDKNGLVLALVSGIMAGFVKGVVGFAVPMILMSFLAMLFLIYTPLAALILPRVISKYQEAHEQGFSNSVDFLKKHELFLSVMALLF